MTLDLVFNENACASVRLARETPAGGAVGGWSKMGPDLLQVVGVAALCDLVLNIGQRQMAVVKFGGNSVRFVPGPEHIGRFDADLDLGKLEGLRPR